MWWIIKSYLLTIPWKEFSFLTLSWDNKNKLQSSTDIKQLPISHDSSCIILNATLFVYPCLRTHHQLTLFFSYSLASLLNCNSQRAQWFFFFYGRRDLRHEIYDLHGHCAEGTNLKIFPAVWPEVRWFEAATSGTLTWPTGSDASPPPPSPASSLFALALVSFYRVARINDAFRGVSVRVG